jgi:hypothetical protein
MVSAALASALKDFSGAVKAPPPSRNGTERSRGGAAAASYIAEPAPAAPDIDAIVAEAVAAAELALAARLTAEHEAVMAEERDRHAAAVAELQERLAVTASAKIAEHLVQMEDRVVELTTSLTARLLGTVLSEDLTKRSVERLAEIIRETVRDDDAVRITVRGAPSLFAALRAALPERSVQFDFTELQGFDLSVAIDDSAFETRLSQWSSALSEVLS